MQCYLDGRIKKQQKPKKQLNMKNTKKVFVLEVIQVDENENGFGLQVRTQNDGFHPLEIVGILEMRKNELIAEITSAPKRNYDTRNPNIN